MITLNDKKRVERILYDYPALLAAMQNEAELEAEGLGDLFPAITANYGQTSGGGQGNTTEKFGVIRADKAIKVRQIERGINALSIKERELVHKKYFDPAQPLDKEVYAALHMQSTKYYQTKDRALRKMATALNII